ncbi:alpha/beta-hydrolase [Coemansia reversa NRRL 1564]|uniref:carboxypeptidase C n=1 Tax=Coemansia reversa (strain ATCC 12441 / NRRL 1564) TaxID=763665 RepID=A0A2G5BL82_COERN|nr:alpha/beta-hydrolase [Coemansia reversa NRRL 1564]|eukprot:PIA19774.1 alpha/beta-hydrolase [Coemansia reversa NRRL 1564]
MNLLVSISAIILAISAAAAAPAADTLDISKGHWSREANIGKWDKVVSHASLPRHQLRSSSTKDVCKANVKQMSGYLDTADDKHFFYWFFEAQNKPKDKSAPLIVWLNGGPGCSSMNGALNILGPCLYSSEANGTVINPHSWNENANLMFLDQPTNVGFSYGTPVSNSTAAADDFVALMQLFYKSYPEYYNGELHVFGESYTGHYIPAIGSAILDHNKKAGSSKNYIPLESIGIGNGLINPSVQYKYLSKMACDSIYPRILPQQTCDQMDLDFPACARKIKECESSHSLTKCQDANTYCSATVQYQYLSEDLLDPYDVRRRCDTVSVCNLATEETYLYLNRTDVQQALNAKETSFQSCSMTVLAEFTAANDVIRSYEDELVKIIDSGLRTLIYVGDADWLCNWYGMTALVEGLNWNGKDKFNSLKTSKWNVNSNQAGEAKSSDNLSYVRIFEAGHMVPRDQPENSLDMINRWLAHKEYS